MTTIFLTGVLNLTSILDKLINYANDQPLIMAVGTEGSLNNDKLTTDPWTDFDITYFATQIKPFHFKAWAANFGTPVIWQHLKNRHLFGQATQPWDTYLVRFEGRLRIDLKLAPLVDLPTYLRADSLNTIIWYRDRMVTQRQTSAKTHFIGIPSQAAFENTLNAFYWDAGNVVKGLARRNLIYANEINNRSVRPQLLKILAWQVSAKRKGQFDVGDHYKFLPRALSAHQYQILSESYNQVTLAATKSGLLTEINMMKVARETLQASVKGLRLPDYVFQAETQLLNWLNELPPLA